MPAQLGKPALLAATYKGDAGAIAAAAMGELEATLVDSLSQLERFSPGAPDARGAGPVGADWAHVYLSVLPTLPVRAKALSPPSNPGPFCPLPGDRTYT